MHLCKEDSLAEGDSTAKLLGPLRRWLRSLPDPSRAVRLSVQTRVCSANARQQMDSITNGICPQRRRWEAERMLL